MSTEVCNRIYTVVKNIYETVEKMDDLKEDARKLYRFVKRSEVLVSDLQPYTTSGDTERMLSAFKDLENVLERTRNLLQDCVVKGKLASYLQADRILDKFQLLTKDLDQSIGEILNANMPLSEETVEEMQSLRSMLQRVHFDVKEDQQQNITEFRDACEKIRQPFAQLLSSCQKILTGVCEDKNLTREDYTVVIDDLQREVKYVCDKEPGGPDEYFLRMMMDLVRISHIKQGPPIEFICPLTCELMTEPVLLAETGQTYERQAIVDWVAKGNKFCPKSGMPLKDKKLHLTTNHAIKGAIHRWIEGQDMQLQFRPLLRTVSNSVPELSAMAAGLSARVSFSPVNGASMANLEEASSEEKTVAPDTPPAIPITSPRTSQVGHAQPSSAPASPEPTVEQGLAEEEASAEEAQTSQA